MGALTKNSMTTKTPIAKIVSPTVEFAPAPLSVLPALMENRPKMKEPPANAPRMEARTLTRVEPASRADTTVQPASMENPASRAKEIEPILHSAYALQENLITRSPICAKIATIPAQLAPTPFSAIPANFKESETQPTRHNVSAPPVLLNKPTHLNADPAKPPYPFP